MSKNYSEKDILFLKQCFASWVLLGIQGQEFYISQSQIDWELYDLLGKTNLMPENVEYLMDLLQTSQTFSQSVMVINLFKQLESFYLRWCNGEFIDAPAENYPQKKMRLLKEKSIDAIGQREVDINTGLNVLILLLELQLLINV